MKNAFSVLSILLTLQSLPTTAQQTGKAFDPTEFGKMFTHHKARVNGIDMHYVSGGKGPLILLIHGWPECWYEWRKVMPLFAQNYTVVSVDLRGAGESTVTESGYDKKTLALDIHELVKQLGFKQAIVVGHDWGAAVAYAYAAQFRESVSHLVVCEGIPFGKWVPKTDLYWYFTFLRFPGNYAEQCIKGNEKAFFTYFYQTAPFHAVRDAINSADMDYYLQYLTQPSRLTASLGFYRTIDQDMIDNNQFSLEPLNMPVFTIGGDHQAKDEVEKTMKNVASNVKGIVMENTGHFVPEERPGEFVKLVLDFLHQNP